MNRVVVWLLAFAAGMALSFVVAAAKAPDAPLAVKLAIGVVAGLALGWLVDLVRRDQREAFDAVFTWDTHRAHEILHARSQRRLRELDSFGVAALEVLIGDVDAAQFHMSRELGKFGPAARLRACVEAQIELRFGDTVGAREMLDRLLALPKFRTEEIERYRVVLLARAALACTDEKRRLRAERALLEHRDTEVRALGQWLRAKRDARPFDDHDHPKAAQRGAELAALHGFVSLAQRLEDRAVAIANANASSPYRHAP